MLHITYKRRKPAMAWRRTAAAHTANMTAMATIAARKQYIDDTASVWSELKPFFEELSSYKCWYTEAKENVSHYDVDHLRPKKKVARTKCDFKFTEAARTNWTDGYWWLCYDWKNYRLSGQIPNRCFKKNYFPLQQGSPVAYAPADDHTTENIVLLDPMVKGDTELITYDMHGKVIPVYTAAQNALNNMRAEVSIRVYGLNDTKLKNAREKIWGRCNRISKKAESKYLLMKGMADKTDPIYIERRDDFIDYCSELIEMVSRDHAFASVSRSCLKSKNYKWIKKWVFDKAVL